MDIRYEPVDTNLLIESIKLCDAKEVPISTDYLLRSVNGLIRERAELLEALEGFLEICGSRNATSESKRAQRIRAELMDKANRAVARARGEGAERSGE